jgi:hypothetical protein
MKKFLMGVVGFVAGAIAGFILALIFGEWLFGWHDNIGPEVRFAFFGGLIGAGLGVIWQTSREDTRKKDRSA